MLRANVPSSCSSRIVATARCVAVVLAATITLIVASPAAGADAGDLRESPPSQPPVEGRSVFQQKSCSGCHSIWGSPGGEPRVGPDLGRNGHWHDLMQFAGSLWNHTPKMIQKMRALKIEQPSLSPDEMGKLAGYLLYVKFLGEPGNVERGREVFEQRSCARCHQLHGRGGTAGPRLDELEGYASSFFMAQALWNHGPEMAAKMADLKLDRPRLEGDDVAHIVAFIRGEVQTAVLQELAYAQAGSPLAGKAVFRERGCIKCHAIAGAGGTVGPDLGTPRAIRTVAETARELWNHGPPMWAKMKDLGVAFPRLTDREMADLLAYLYFVQYTGTGGDAAKGGALFRVKSCARCHAAGGEGPKVGPDLARAGTLRSPIYWASAMWNHAAAVEQKTHETQIDWPQFENDEMRDLVAFLQLRAGIK